MVLMAFSSVDLFRGRWLDLVTRVAGSLSWGVSVIVARASAERVEIHDGIALGARPARVSPDVPTVSLYYLYNKY